jgi:hypothetical protein
MKKVCFLRFGFLNRKANKAITYHEKLITRHESPSREVQKNQETILPNFFLCKTDILPVFYPIRLSRHNVYVIFCCVTNSQA